MTFRHRRFDAAAETSVSGDFAMAERQNREAVPADNPASLFHACLCERYVASRPDRNQVLDACHTGRCPGRAVGLFLFGP